MRNWQLVSLPSLPIKSRERTQLKSWMGWSMHDRVRREATHSSPSSPWQRRSRWLEPMPIRSLSTSWWDESGFSNVYGLLPHISAKRNQEYSWLQGQCPPPWEQFYPASWLCYDPFHFNDIRWNFEKFLINHEGNPVKRCKIRPRWFSLWLYGFSIKSNELLLR